MLPNTECPAVFLIPTGVMPFSKLYAICFCRLRAVSPMVFCIDSVILSAYIITLPLMFLAARPTICTIARSDLKNPSLSASKIAIKDTSGKSRPSRSKLIPIKTSKTPLRKSANISTRSRVSISECMYLQRTPALVRNLANSSAMRFVKVVIKVRSSRLVTILISCNKSSI